MAGLAPGVLITEVNRESVTSAEEFGRAAAAALGRGESLLLLVRQGGHSRFVVLRLQN